MHEPGPDTRVLCVSPALASVPLHVRCHCIEQYIKETFSAAEGLERKQLAYLLARQVRLALLWPTLLPARYVWPSCGLHQGLSSRAPLLGTDTSGGRPGFSRYGRAGMHHCSRLCRGTC